MSLFNFRSERRRMLDALLQEHVSFFRGAVLDLGGQKKNKRGHFRPPASVKSWSYLNNNPATEPDVLCDVGEVPLESGCADVVVCTEVLEYTAEPAKVMREAGRLLKAGGEIFLAVPFLHPIHGDAECDRWRFTANGVRSLFSEADFHPPEIAAMGGIGSTIFDFWHTVLMRLSCGRLRLVALLVLHATRPVYLLLDSFLPADKTGVTTGYFARAQKKGSAAP